METNLDWSNLSFGYMKTHYNVRCTCKDGKWGEIEVTDSERVDLHMAATCLHSGQEIFEGLKAFRGKDGKIRIFRLEENAKRIQRSAEGILMEPLPVEEVREMVGNVVGVKHCLLSPCGVGISFRRMAVAVRCTSVRLSLACRLRWVLSLQPNICF